VLVNNISLLFVASVVEGRCWLHDEWGALFLLLNGLI